MARWVLGEVLVFSERTHFPAQILPMHRSLLRFASANPGSSEQNRDLDFLRLSRASGIAIEEFVGDEDAPLPVMRGKRKPARSRIAVFTRLAVTLDQTSLTKRQRQVAKHRSAGLSLAAIGTRLGISAARVCQIEARLMSRARRAANPDQSDEARCRNSPTRVSPPHQDREPRCRCELFASPSLPPCSNRSAPRLVKRERGAAGRRWIPNRVAPNQLAPQPPRFTLSRYTMQLRGVATPKRQLRASNHAYCRDQS